LLTRWFGAGRDTDVYFIVFGAAQLTAFVIALVIESCAMPFGAKALHRGPRELTMFARSLLRYALVFAVPVTTVLVLLVIGLLLPLADLPAQQEHTGRLLLAAFAPLPALAATASVFSSAHYLLDRFATTALSQGLRAGGGILFAALFAQSHGIVAVAVGVCIGEAVRALVLAATLPRGQLGWREGWGLPLQVGSEFLRAASPMLLATIIVAVNPMVDKTIAARLGSGSTTLIELAEKLFYIPAVLLGAAISRVSASVWARLIDRDDDALRRDYWRVQRLGGAVTIALAALAAVTVFVLRDVIAEVLSLRPGTPFAVVFALYIIGLPLALASDLGAVLLVSARRTGALPSLAIVLVVVNLIADLIGAHYLGVLGIALSSTIVRGLNAVAFLALSALLLRGRGKGRS